MQIPGGGEVQAQLKTMFGDIIRFVSRKDFLSEGGIPDYCLSFFWKNFIAVFISLNRDTSTLFPDSSNRL